VKCPISQQALLRPDHVALLSEERTWTYRELDKEVDALSFSLQNAGVKENQRVAFIAKTESPVVLLFFALFRLRAIACPLSYRLPPLQVTEAVEQLKAHHFFEPSALSHSYTREKPAPAFIPVDNLATFLFTSGTSGKPKIACSTFANHYYNALGAIPALGLESTSRWLISLPLFHVAGISVLFRCFLKGATVVLSDSPLWQTVYRFGISHLSLVPTQLFRLLKGPVETIERVKLSLKCLMLGAAPLSPLLLKTSKLHGLPLYTTYSMTEMCSTIAINGKVLPFRELKLHKGEILVRGKMLFKGYWDSKTEAIDQKSGWFPTKDLGKYDAEASLIITGRKDRQFISGGENIQPEEIESALCSLPGIRRAAVLPIDDVEFGQRPVAFIDDETGKYTVESLKNALQERLPSFKHPIRIFPYPDEEGMKINLANLRELLSKSLG